MRTVPNFRVSVAGASFALPVMRQTTTNFLPTSMPAHRSITAGIITCLLFRLELASAYPFTSCSASRGSFKGALHAGRSGSSPGLAVNPSPHYAERPPAPANGYSRPFSCPRVARSGGPCEVHLRLRMPCPCPNISTTRPHPTLHHLKPRLPRPLRPPPVIP